MRLLLDEHYSRQIAEQLRRRGHDVESVQERLDLRGLGDRELLQRATGDGRALMTENVADFALLMREFMSAGERHLGLVFTSPRSMPRGTATIGRYVDELDAFLRDRPGEDALADTAHWLGAG